MVEGCSHVRQHISGCLPEKSGGSPNRSQWTISHRVMSVVREEGNDCSSLLSSRTSESVSGPSVQEGSNPQDRLEPKPDRSRQDFSCLGQTIRGSVRPREEHEIGKIRLTHSGRRRLGKWTILSSIAYPPTSLLRACLIKVRTENVRSSG